MTINSVDKSWSRESASKSTDNGIRFQAEVQEGYQVTHSADATIGEIINANGIPVLNQLRNDGVLVCRNVGPVQRIGPVFSIVPVTWRGEVGAVGDSPLNQNPDIVWSNTSTNEPVDEDIFGNPIVTANNEPIHGATRLIPDLVLSVTRNYALFSPWLTWQYLHSVNGDTFLNFAPGTGKFMSFNARQTVSNGLSYWRVSATIQFRYPYRTTFEKAWWARVRHEGFKVKLNAKAVNGKDDFRQPLAKPVMLNRDGTERKKTAAGVTPPADWLEFQLYTPLPYAALGLI
jgi:hypothetical protein